jgi:superfamily I DNA/RNA helicase
MLAVYELPNVFGAAKFCRLLLAQTPPFLRVLRPAALRIFSALIPGPNDAYDQLQDAVVSYKLAIQLEDVVVATVHRSKGHQFEHVLISNVSGTHFPDDEEGRRLLYVALSRCRRSLTILVPAHGRSPLIAQPRAD